MSVLVTGAHGCLGAWTVRDLAVRGLEVVALDLQPGWGRMEMIVEPALRQRVSTIQADVVDAAQVDEVFDRYRPSYVVHLAGLLGPACDRNPALGVSVNVLGSVHLFEAAIRHRVEGFSYASTVAVFGASDHYGDEPLDDVAAFAPTNHYGATKAAVELIASAYWQTRGFPSIGLRPGVVYGLGRDTGTSADPVTALESACRGERSVIRFTGAMDLQYAPDVAWAFVECALRGAGGSPVFNVRGDVVTVEDYVRMVDGFLPGAGALIDCTGPELAWPPSMSGTGLRSHLGGQLRATPLHEGLRQLVTCFEPTTQPEGTR